MVDINQLDPNNMEHIEQFAQHIKMNIDHFAEKAGNVGPMN